MKINYPGSRFEPMTPDYLWTLRHPLALFNPQSLYHRIRAEIDHRRVFLQYLWNVRDEIGEIEVRPPAGEPGTVAQSTQASHGVVITEPWVRRDERVLQAAAGINDFVLDVHQPDFAVDARISLPNVRDLSEGTFRLSASGPRLPNNQPAAMFVIDRDAARQVCEAADCDLQDIKTSLRKALAEAAVGDGEEMAYTLAGIPSLFSSTNHLGRVEFRVDDVPAGHYMLPGDAFKIVCYAGV